MRLAMAPRRGREIVDSKMNAAVELGAPIDRKRVPSGDRGLLEGKGQELDRRIQPGHGTQVVPRSVKCLRLPDPRRGDGDADRQRGREDVDRTAFQAHTTDLPRCPW